MTMSLGPYASFIVTSYAAAGIVVALLIGWVIIDYRNQTARLRELERSGVTRRSGRSAVDTPRTTT
ncbi:heme exporter protein CcmD [uncultured Bradyrhizobium sp.]|jgi:heme exporter protein D|uniref:heme exporter protein CcmD n=1 Tax=uncultured Bradyrhizobium sp. TaxID=199684 RepID=UPI0026315D61|nr:heme exporter protein CcmD [uncultured Bradyrhizobium sp.]